MIEFTKPKNLNGSELLAELEAAGIKASNPTLDDNDVFKLDIDNKDVEKAKPIIAAHNGTVISVEPSLEEKLTWVGLSVNDLKAALGI